MIRNRARDAAIGISLSIFIALAMLSYEGKIGMDAATTGFVVHEPFEHKGEVMISGTGFSAEVGGREYWYIFTHDNRWYESKDKIVWERRDDMGNSIWKGLLYMKSYDAKIYFRGKEVDSIGRFVGDTGKNRLHAGWHMPSQAAGRNAYIRTGAG